MAIHLNLQSLQSRLSLVLWGAVLLAFVLAGAGLVLVQLLTLEDRAQQIMHPYAQMIAVGTDAAIAFEDPVRAQEILGTLENNPQILEAEIVLESGVSLASFGTMSRPLVQDRMDRPDGVYIGDDRAELLQMMPRGARLRLSMSLDQLNEQTYRVLWLFGTAMLLLLAATYGQLIVLRRTIVRPIASLTNATELIRDRADYSHRVPAVGNDEIARLGHSFNAMMEVIHEREGNLRRLSTFQRTILNNAAYVIISSTPDGLITSYNPAAERLLGYTADEVVDKQTPALWHDPEELKQRAEQLSKRFGETVAPGFAVFTACPSRDLPEDNEWTFVCKDGKRIPVQLSVSALRGEDGQVTGFVGFAYDLTERKRAEQQLRQHKDELEQTVQQRTAELMLARDAAEAANKAKSVFLANMSHELRTPLNAILGFSSLISRDPEFSASQRENIEIINRSGEHLLRLINDVLEIAKIEAGKLQLEISSFDFGSMVRDVVDMMRIRAEGKGLELLLDMTSECPRYITGDEARLRQIVINLVGNAVKFTAQGGVSIRFRTCQNERLHLQIEVEDSGPGISKEDINRLFKPFVQLAEGGEQKGTGLGLTITRQFVELMEGSVAVESTLGKGTTFRVDLPIELADSADAVLSEPIPHIEIVGLVPGQPHYKILVAEDQYENQLLLSNLMTDIGIEVMRANNGEQCVRIFQEWHPDLIWMDIRMPVMDGKEATQHIRRLPGGDKVKIVAVTASAFMEEQQEMLAAGMNDFVRKPFRFDEIYKCLEKQLGLKYLTKIDGAKAEDAVVLTPAMLAVLPDKLREKLSEDLISLDIDRIDATVEEITRVDAKLGRTLSRMTAGFDYQVILDTLNAKST